MSFLLQFGFLFVSISASLLLFDYRQFHMLFVTGEVKDLSHSINVSYFSLSAQTFLSHLSEKVVFTTALRSRNHP